MLLERRTSTGSACRKDHVAFVIKPVKNAWKVNNKYKQHSSKPDWTLLPISPSLTDNR